MKPGKPFTKHCTSTQSYLPFTFISFCGAVSLVLENPLLLEAVSHSSSPASEECLASAEFARGVETLLVTTF